MTKRPYDPKKLKLDVDPNAETRPHWVVQHAPRSARQRRSGCLILFLPVLLLACILGMYLLAPIRTNVLILGIDRAPEGTDLSRSDTLILTTFLPLQPYVGMLSIPRDLWVVVPGVGENRINTAHFYAENTAPGTGPAAAMDTIRQNFGVDVGYYIRIRFDGIEHIVDAMGGLQVELTEPMSGYPAGRHTLTGEQALAFVRDRSGTDDFFRMGRGQLFLKSALQQLMLPTSWIRLPVIISAAMESIDTNVPSWHWPRMLFAILRVGPGEIDSRTISREMVFPFTTNQGAQVLGPNWDAINPVLLEMFGQ